MGNGEAELLRSAQSGDDRAFGRLVAPYVDPAYRMAARILGGRPEAEDAVQEALYRAWRALPSFRGDAKFSTWLYRIVWRVSVNLVRRDECVPLDADLADAAGERDPEQRFEAVERQGEVERAIRSLPVHYRAAVTLHYVEDLPLREIAEILELPEGTVKTHLHRARKALKEKLSELAGREERG